MLTLLCLASLAGLLVVGALIDMECRRLPNWLTSAVAALYGLFVIVSPTPVDWMNAFLVAGLMFTLGFAFFAFGFMGGGDVKLMAGLALWAGIDHIALFLITTSLGGGALAVIMMIFRRVMASPLVLVISPFLGLAHRWPFRTSALAASSPSARLTEADADISLPYGVAIAAGGFVVIYALLQL